MSNSIRFLGFALLSWALVRAVSLGLIPGTQALAFDAQAAQRPRPLPPIQPTHLPPIEPLSVAQYPSMGPSYPPQPAFAAMAAYPVYVPVPSAGPQSAPPQIIYVSPPPGEPREVHVYGSEFGQVAEPRQLAMAAPPPAHQSTPSFEQPKRPGALKRLSLDSWAVLRKEGGPDSLARNGLLGGSEAGARLMWRFSPNLAASLRASAPVNSQRGVEAALGVRYQPFTAWPVAVTLERRHGFRQYGQSAFALFAEGGVYGRAMVWGSSLDGYFQAGVVDFNDPDWFVDGQVAVSRPLWRNLSAGVGAWGGAQPGLHRLDLGPRLSLKVGNRARVHFDYRVNLIGNARPGTGPAVTVAGSF